MASSESEDFESADEDICIEDTKPVTVKPEEPDRLRPTSRPSPIPTDTKPKEDKLPTAASKSDGREETDTVTIPENKANNNIEAAPKNVKECKESTQDMTGAPPVVRKQRQQRQREQKVSSKPKKLGTKITSEVMSIKCDNEHHSETDKKAQEQKNSELNANTNVATSDVDPYEQFKGYSIPPLVEQCWEPGVNNYALYGIDPPESFHDKTENITEKSVTSEEQASSEDSVAPVLDKLLVAADKTESSWGGWGSWGVTSLLSTATESVSTLTSHVSSVLESGIGAPKPEELARISQLEKEKYETEAAKPQEPVPVSEEESVAGLFNFGQLMTSVSSISKLVESTGSKVISGGLDTLETIGKKTMEVLQEGDPGLKKKRAMFSETTVLSQVLREAKEQAEVQDRIAESQQELRSIHFETLFDEYQGLVHLEALEMLSKQCDLKLQSLLLSSTGATLSQHQGNLQKIKECCHLPDEEEVNDEENQPDEWWKELASIQDVLAVPVAADKFSKIWNESQEWLKNSMKSEEEKESAREIHKKAVSTLAQLTATAMEQFHKGTELLLVKEQRDPAEEAKALKQMTSILCSQVTTTATNFCERMNSCTEEGPSDSINALITNVFLEASNSSSYIQEAFQLLIPVLQVGMFST